MTYIKINNTKYPATINGKMSDTAWDGRESKAVTLEMDYAQASALFVDGIAWSIVQQDEVPVYDEEGTQTGTEVRETEWDNSEYSIAGSITDHRNGTVTAKMGKPTKIEMMEAQLANAVTEEEISNAYEEGVNSL